ncbi:metallophosphoesterase [Luteimonas aquatica]|uniref:metallophosphoesterase n=1 Tax=Luteimonas aquatica TaxID=450364 RepID=UPI001F58E4AB|nr:metallophosphoesterase [Luteimonas aquatica]
MRRRLSRFLRRWRLPLSLLGLVLLGLAVWGFVIEPGRLVERDYAMALPNWPAACDGLRLDVIADTHTGSPRNGVDNLDRVVRRLVDSDSKAVLMAGDYVILSVFLGTYVPPEEIAAHLKPLTARKPVYAVLGNHDWWKDGGRVRRALESAGVVVLENQARELQLGRCRFWLAGIGDFWEGHPQVARTFAAVGDDAPVIALTHNPDIFPAIPPRAALTIAGHTHGGQVRLPLLGALLVPASHRYVAGPIDEHGRHLFVSTGIGTSIMPVRLGVPPEISRLTLQGGAASP